MCKEILLFQSLLQCKMGRKREKSYNNKKTKITGTGVFKVVTNGPKSAIRGKKKAKAVTSNLKRVKT